MKVAYRHSQEAQRVRDFLPGFCLNHEVWLHHGVHFYLDHPAAKLTARVEDGAGLEESLSRWDGKATSRANGGWPRVPM